MSVEERKENRMLMAQAVLNNGKAGAGRLQNAAAAVLGGGSGYKPALTDERRNTLGGGANAQLPPSGYRGASMNNYPRANTGNGQTGSYADPFGSAGYGSGSYNNY